MTQRALQLHAAGRLAEAEQLYRAALAADPANSDATYGLGVLASQTGRHEEAVKLLRPDLVSRSPNPLVHVALGASLRNLGRVEEAIACHRQAIRLAPQFADAHNNLGNALRDTGALAEAVAAYRAALAINPRYAEAHFNLANALRDQGSFDDAEASFRWALEVRPEYPEAMHNLGALLADTGRVDEAVRWHERALAVRPNPYIHSSLVYLLHFHPDFDPPRLARELARWNDAYAAPTLALFRNDPSPDRRLRIGYVSPDFYAQAECYFILPLLQSHDRSRFEIHCYAGVRKADEITRRMRSCVDHWYDVRMLSDEALAEKIRADGIDILVDLTMHMADHRLLAFARKPAPVQVTWLAYPGSTGLTAIDYRLTDGYVEPEGTANPFAEQAVRLPDSWCCYDPISETPPVSPLPAMAAGFVTFGSLNTFRKMSPKVLALWADVLRAVEKSRLIMLRPDGKYRQEVLRIFQKRGVDPQRLQLVGSMPRPEYLRKYQEIDIGLDPLPYNGNLTTCDALWMGVPVLSLTGTTACGRCGLSVQTVAGLPEWIATTPEEFIRKAQRFTSSLNELAHLRSGLRAKVKASPLMDTPRFARGIEAAYRRMWRTWCQSQPGGVTAPPQPPVAPAAQPAPVVSAESAEAHFKRSNALLRAGQLAEAAAALREAVRLKPDYAAAQANLGVILAELGELADAVSACQRAASLMPRSAEAHNNLGNALKLMHRNEEALAAYREALALKPAYPEAMHSSAAILGEAGRVAEAVAWHQKGLALRPDPVQHSSLLYLMQFDPACDTAQQAAELARWNQQYALPLLPRPVTHANDPSPERRLRVGYVSPDFRAHCQSFFTLPLLRAHDRKNFEIHCYASVRKPDEITQHLRNCGGAWHDVRTLSDAALADKIRTDQIDILVDLTMHMVDHRLLVFARKPAPVQVAWLAYPGTTGLTAMDYRLTDPHLDPPGEHDAWYTEKSLRLPDCFWCYDPLAAGMAPPGAPPVTTSGRITFGSLNSPRKLHPDLLDLWARVLSAVEGSRLLLLCMEGPQRQQAVEIFARRGISADRIEFLSLQPRGEYLKLYDRIDICLDPHPVNGHTTSLDALWMGVPVVTLVGDGALARAGLCQLTNLGLPELIARTPDEYVRIAVELARDLPRLKTLRETLRGRMERSPLMDAPRFARNLEAAYRQMWRKWCASQSSGTVAPQKSAVTPAAQPAPTASTTSPEAQFKLGNSHVRAGRLEEAAQAFGEAVRLKPQYAPAQANLGVVLAELGRLEDARQAFERAAALLPAAGEIRNNLGNVLKLMGKLDEALAAFDDALKLKPAFAEALGNRAAALKDLGRLDEAVTGYRKTLQLRPDDAANHSSLILCLHYMPGCTAASILAEERAWAQRHAEPLRKLIRAHANDRNAGRRLRIGYVSGDFRDHVVARNLLPLFASHDHAHFEIFCYSNVARVDAMTGRLRTLADQWRDIASVGDEQAADMIRSDRIDILVDLALHSAGNRLLIFARRPAPIQVTFAGYPGGTGLAMIDYRLGDPFLDPQGSDGSFVEQTLRLAHSFWCYDPAVMAPDDAPQPGPLPAHAAGQVTFGCLNTPCKVNDAVLKLWARVLAQVPNSRLVMLAASKDHGAYVTRTLERSGVEAARLELLERLPRPAYFRTYTRIDLALDTVPYNGHTTSLDALWMGVPVVTLVGPTVVGRAGLSQLSNLGLPELVARTDEEYVSIAVGLANDPAKLAALRASLRPRMLASPLADGPGFAKAIQAAYRQMWLRWCRGSPDTEEARGTP